MSYKKRRLSEIFSADSFTTPSRRISGSAEFRATPLSNRKLTMNNFEQNEEFEKIEKPEIFNSPEREENQEVEKIETPEKSPEIADPEKNFLGGPTFHPEKSPVFSAPQKSPVTSDPPVISDPPKTPEPEIPDSPKSAVAPGRV